MPKIDKLILTVKTALQKKYGADYSEVLDLLNQLVNSDKEKGLNSMLLFLDDSTKPESRKIGKISKVLNLKQQTGDPVVGKLKLADAEKKLLKGLKNLNKLSKSTPPLKPVKGPGNSKIFVPVSTKNKKGFEKPAYVLVLDHDEGEGENIRPHLPFESHSTMELAKSKGIKKPSSEKLPSIKLDPLTVIDDKNYFKNLQNEKNLPDYVKSDLKALYKSHI